MLIKKWISAVLVMGMLFCVIPVMANQSNTENFQSKTPTEFTAGSSEIETIYQKDGDNIYWYAGHAVADETSPGGQTFQNYQFSDMLADTTLTSGDYVVSFRFKCDNTDGWSHPAAVRLMAKSGGKDAHFKLDEIKTKVGSTSTETTKVSFNNDVLTTFLCNEKLIKSGEWYTFRATYQLDEQKASLDLYNSAGEPIIGTQNVTLPASEITLSSITVGLDTRFKPLIGIDDITVAKIEKPVSVACNIGENGTVTVNGAVKQNGDTIEILKGESLTVTVAPSEHYRVASVKLGNTDGMLINGKYTFETVLENTELTVMFAEDKGEQLPASWMETFQSKTPTEFTTGSSEIETIYQKDGDNIYWYAGHAVADETSPGGQTFQNYQFSDMLADTTLTSGDYVVSFRFKCDNTDGWSHPAAVRLMAKSGGKDAHFKLDEIKTKVGSTSTDTTKVYFNNDELTTFLCTGKLIKSGEWYTFRVTYQLDEKKASLDLYNPAGEPIIETQNVTLPAPEITLSSISVGLDSRFKPQIGIDDITITKEGRVPIVVTGNEGGTISYQEERISNTSETVVIPYDGEAVFTITPNEGYHIKSVKKSDGQELGVVDSVIYTGLKNAESLTVVFEKDVISAGIAKTAEVMAQTDYNGKYFAVIAYTQLTNFTETDETKEMNYGFDFWKGSATKPESDILKLYAYGFDQQPAKATPGAQYAIRVYGENIINPNESYSMRPFIGNESGEIITYPSES